MKHCADYEERLNDYLDNLLAPPERAGVEQHLEGCAGCREALAAMRSLRERTASLPRSVEPARNLWPGIRDSLAGPRRPVPGSILGFPAWMTGWGRLVPAAASVALVLLVAVAVVIALRRDTVQPGPGEADLSGTGPAPIARGETAPPAGPAGSGAAPVTSTDSGPSPAVPAGVAPARLPQQEPLEMAEAEYRAATEKLLAALQRERGAASLEAVKVIEENLRIVEGAIQEIHRAAVDHPGHKVDERVVISLYRTRFELLRQAVRLFSREGEEKQS